MFARSQKIYYPSIPTTCATLIVIKLIPFIVLSTKGPKKYSNTRWFEMLW